MNALSRLSQRLANIIPAFIDDEDGSDLAEYTLVLVLLAVVAILALEALGEELRIVYCDVAKAMGAQDDRCTCGRHPNHPHDHRH